MINSDYSITEKVANKLFLKTWFPALCELSEPHEEGKHVDSQWSWSVDFGRGC